MQYVLMSRNKVYNWFLHRIVNSLTLLFHLLVPYLPRLFLRVSAVIVVTPIFLFWPKYRNAAADNLAIILGSQYSRFELNRIVYRIYRNFARYVVDIFYFRDKSHDTIQYFLDEVHGVPSFEETLEKGKGAVLLTAHLGNWELGGYFLGRKNLPINVVYFPDRFSGMERLRSKSRESMRVREINVGTGLFTGLPIIQALRRNEIVAMQGDRDFRDDGMEVDFFGRNVSFPTGPVLCAMAAGSPIIPVFILETPAGKYSILSLDPLWVTGSIRNPEDIRQNLQQVSRVIERMVRDNYDQWYCFYPFFERTGSKNGESNSRQCSEKTKIPASHV